MKLDLSKLKKVESNDQYTVMQHERGHQLKIAHQKLTPEFRKQLDEMPLHKAKGGMAGPSKPSKPVQDTGYTEPKDIGTPAVPSGVSTSGHPCINPSCRSYGKVHPNCKCYGMAKGGEVDHFCAHGGRMHRKDCEYFQDGGDVRPSETPSPQPTPSETPSPSPSPEPTAPPSPTPVPEFQSGPGDSGQQQTEQAPEPSQDQAVPESEQPVTEQAVGMADRKQQIKNDLDYETAAHEQDVAAGHIKPETYKALMDKSTFGKVGAIFGMLLSGMGSGLARQPNMLMEMWNNTIKNDLESQKNSAQNAQNLLRINQANELNKAQTGNLTAEAATKAYALTQAQMLQLSFHDQVLKVAKMPEGPQKQQAMATMAALYPVMKDKINNINDLAASTGAFASLLQGGGQGSPQNTMFMKSGLLGPEAAKVGEDVESKRIPGIPGLAAAPLAGADKQEIGSGMEFDKQLNNFMDWTKTHSGDLNPVDRKYGEALAAQLQGSYRQATHGGVYKEGEQNFISKIITDEPTKFFNKIRVLPQLNAVRDDLHNRLDQSLKNKGFAGYPGIQQQQQPQTVMSKSGRPMYQQNGKWYYKQ